MSFYAAGDARSNPAVFDQLWRGVLNAVCCVLYTVYRMLYTVY